MDKSEGTADNYPVIARLLWAAFVLLGVVLVVFQLRPVDEWLADYLAPASRQFLELGLFGSLGGLIAAYKYLANDIEINELEAAKDKPDTAILRYPTGTDVHLYGLRILSSGVLGAISGLLVMLGMVYFQVDMTDFPLRQRLFMVLLAFLVGLQENDFLGFLSSLRERILRSGKVKGGAKKV